MACACCAPAPGPAARTRYVYAQDIGSDGPEHQWELMKFAQVPGYEPVDWEKMSEKQRAQAAHRRRDKLEKRQSIITAHGRVK